MTVKIISILLTFFILVMVNQAGAEGVKSMKNTANQETIIKMDDNRVHVLKRAEPAKERGAKLRVNFLKASKEKKKFQWTDSVHKVISSYELFQDPWRDRSLRTRETNETNPPDSSPGRFVPKLHLSPGGDEYFEQGKIQSALKLLQSKREEIFDEIFVGFRFSFGSKNTHMLPEIRISPSLEKGSGFTIAF
jgi:hypothetical protein